MLRWLIFLPLCLFLQDLRWTGEQDFPTEGPTQENRSQEPGEQIIEEILRTDPPKFLQMSLDRYEREVQGYSCILVKKERVEGKVKPTEKTECHFKEEPFSVYMNWLKGVGEAQRVLYVKGENKDKMLARPAGLLGLAGVLPFDTDSPKAKKAGRYLITQFGIKLGTERTRKAMLSAQTRNALFWDYKGIFLVPEVGNRRCYKLVRTPYEPLEDEGVYELTIYLDVETWLQVGSILKGPNDQFIAEYFFRDVRINPAFKENQFKKSAL